MSGHSHWSGIKHKKGATDAKRGKVFSKLLKAISAAAKSEPNPDFNPRLRTAVLKAKEANVPADTILRAITWASDPGDSFEELLFEAYGPGGAAILIEAVSDNRNRTVAEVKAVIAEFGGKWAEAGSVRWAFEHTADERGFQADQRGFWKPKFTQAVSSDDATKIKKLVEALHEHEDVEEVYTNSSF